ncbi:hypothetical protein [Palleronia pelagia]|uniref:Dolichyl-phosphate-mannose-protein mannosyltransferase n=1 Tax=Palleronia pelagia TaxID=387096 RepID=A0A1H8HD91_9RHOB|nr:hypothetical protein [Palleronia pelagia]SEN53924.1 hypothetical protein SAMN04488011_104391 [Palleronia pelagia]
MSRFAAWLIFQLAIFSLLMLWLAWLEFNGFVSSAVTDLWARALVQVGGTGTFSASDSFYPPVPFALTLLVELLPGNSGVPPPFLVAALIASTTLVLWFLNLRVAAGFSILGAVLSVLLIGLNPYFLRAVSDGPEMMMILLGTWVFARGVVNLRLTGAAPDMMKVAVGLLIVALSDSFGLMISFGALPFMVLAARPSMLERSAAGYLVALFFPVAAAIGSLLFVSSIFQSSLIPRLFEVEEAVSPGEYFIIVSGLLPLGFVLALRNLSVMRLFMPTIAAVGSVSGAYFLNYFFQAESDPVIASVPILGVVVVCLRFWPPSSFREPIVLVLLCLLMVHSVQALRISGTGETDEWARAALGHYSDLQGPTRMAAQSLQGKAGIMLDVERNPEMVVAFGDVSRLLTSGQPAYDLALEGGRLRAPYILVPKVMGMEPVSDRILRRFPGLASGAQAGYRQIYQNSKWQIFQRLEG